MGSCCLVTGVPARVSSTQEFTNQQRCELKLVLSSALVGSCFPLQKAKFKIVTEPWVDNFV